MADQIVVENLGPAARVVAEKADGAAAVRPEAAIEGAATAPTVTAATETNPDGATADEATQSADAGSGDDTDSGDEAAESADGKPDTDPAQPHKKKGGWQRRIDKETARRVRAEADALAAKAEADALRRRLDGGGKPVEPEKPAVRAADGKPNPNDFDSNEAYLDARDAWRDAERTKAERVHARETADQRHQRETDEAYTKRVEAFRAEAPDFDDVLEAANDALTAKGQSLSITLQQVILESEHGPAMLHELAKKPAELVRISALPAIAQAKALGVLEDRIATARAAAKDKKPEPKVTRAPAPPTPVRGGSAAPARSLDDLPFSEFCRERDRQELEKRKRG